MALKQSKATSRSAERLQLKNGQCYTTSARTSRLVIEAANRVGGRGDLHCEDTTAKT